MRDRSATAAATSPDVGVTGPSTERGRRARTQLVVAARLVFERDGFLNARVTDIATQAGVSHGTFYTYFGSKAEVFRVLMSETMDHLYDSLGEADEAAPTSDPVAVIDRANRRFIAMYRSNAVLMALFEQVTTFDPEVRALRLAVRRRIVRRVARSIERLQAQGQADAGLDPHCSANALVAMVNGLVHYWLVLGDEDLDEEQLAQTLTRLWARSTGLP